METEEFLERKSEFGHIFDVRSPLEFASSHIPNSENLLVLTNEERAEVGTIYKQVSPFDAKMLGARLICKNMAAHLEHFYPRISPKDKIAIYCARGGMRSGAAATILGSIGYRVVRIRDGYKGYRSRVAAYLEEFPHKNFFVLHGPTGSGKSLVIDKLSWSIDLEGMAGHMGSSFGSIMGGQPSSKMFQNRLFEAISGFGESDAILIEGESKKIGSVMLPSLLYQRMSEGFGILIEMPLEFRVAHIAKQYGGIDRQFFDTAMEKIKPYMKGSSWSGAKEAFYAGNKELTAEILLLEYYDKVYKKPKKIDLVLRPKSIEEAAEEIEKLKKVDLS